MATYAAYKHIELYNVGKAKKRYNTFFFSCRTNQFISDHITFFSPVPLIYTNLDLKTKKIKMLLQILRFCEQAHHK